MRDNIDVNGFYFETYDGFCEACSDMKKKPVVSIQQEKMDEEFVLCHVHLVRLSCSLPLVGSRVVMWNKG